MVPDKGPTPNQYLTCRTFQGFHIGDWSIFPSWKFHTTQKKNYQHKFRNLFPILSHHPDFYWHLNRVKWGEFHHCWRLNPINLNRKKRKMNIVRQWEKSEKASRRRGECRHFSPRAQRIRIGKKFIGTLCNKYLFHSKFMLQPIILRVQLQIKKGVFFLCRRGNNGKRPTIIKEKGLGESNEREANVKRCDLDLNQNLR